MGSSLSSRSDLVSVAFIASCSFDTASSWIFTH
jgi:hypothetical protein